ncbi:uncharacterized protein L201_006116 [Kwoniella dendrophila CBS 6074]|uniref:Uncharacterized protein n=1 Tax=Kwoniella dendrophila CBS 6074 TaxID=1295534 RepID=A0AAX4K341_9TREE
MSKLPWSDLVELQSLYLAIHRKPGSSISESVITSSTPSLTPLPIAPALPGQGLTELLIILVYPYNPFLIHNPDIPQIEEETIRDVARYLIPLIDTFKLPKHMCLSDHWLLVLMDQDDTTEEAPFEKDFRDIFDQEIQRYIGEYPEDIRHGRNGLRR